MRGGDEFNDAILESDAQSGRVLLKVKRQGFWYREHGDLTADLIVFNSHLPDSLCLGLPRDRHRLTRLLEHEADVFYIASDPLVRSLRNEQRLGRPAIVLNLLPTWSPRHWDLGDSDEASAK